MFSPSFTIHLWYQGQSVKQKPDLFQCFSEKHVQEGETKDVPQEDIGANLQLDCDRCTKVGTNNRKDTIEHHFSQKTGVLRRTGRGAHFVRRITNTMSTGVQVFKRSLLGSSVVYPVDLVGATTFLSPNVR